MCEPGDGDQCPNDKKPIFFTSASTRAAQAAFPAGEAAAVCYFQLAAPTPRPMVSVMTTVPVNVDNFARAESGRMFAAILRDSGGVNQWMHNRVPTPLDHQPIIRQNRDTL